MKPEEPEEGRDGPSSIVVGVDGSVTAHRAAWYAAGLARRQGARLVWVYVAPPAPLMTGGTGEGGVVVAERAAQAETRTVLETLAAETASEFRVGLTFLAPSGDPYREIIRVADETKADAIVVGASLKPAHRIVGSLGVRLARAGRWPVTVVP